MMLGTLLVCGRCGGCLEILNERLSAEWLDSHRDEFRCDDCGTPLELAIEDPALARVTDAIKAAWQSFGEVPFPLYDREAEALARAAIKANAEAA
jgi:hypothetical protein